MAETATHVVRAWALRIKANWPNIAAGWGHKTTARLSCMKQTRYRVMTAQYPGKLLPLSSVGELTQVRCLKAPTSAR